jgi:hypothetical protein
MRLAVPRISAGKTRLVRAHRAGPRREQAKDAGRRRPEAMVHYVIGPPTTEDAGMRSVSARATRCLLPAHLGT